MKVHQQIQQLIQNAPQDGVMPTVMEKAIAPVLTAYANQLHHQQYYIFQTANQEWVLTTLSNRADPTLEKKVIYAFATLEDAMLFQGSSNPNLTAHPIPSAHILFQLFALKPCESAVFMDTPGNLTAGVEIHRSELQKLVQQQLEALGLANPPTPPPDLA